MDREATLAQSAADDLVSDRQGFVLAYSGRLKDARLMAQRAANLNQEPAQQGKAALFEIGPALWDAFFGDLPAARKSAVAVADLSMDRDVEYGAAFALALSGELPRSRALAKDLDARFPEDTAVKGFYLPAIRALLIESSGSLPEPSHCCKSPDPMIGAYHLLSLPRSSGHSLQSMCVAWPIWPHTRRPKPPRNSRKFSMAARSWSAIPSAHWRTCNWAERWLCRR